MNKWREKYRQFKEWQCQPPQVAPLSDKQHTCNTCGTVFQGNFCPRCGQSAKIGRYSAKTALLNFIDVWGLGNRGMFRSVRDLILSPGYMIHNYLSGMQMAYFPPFKMFFLLTTLSLLIGYGMNIERRNNIRRDEIKVEIHKSLNEIDTNEKADDEIERKKRIGAFIEKSFNAYMEYQESYPNIVSLCELIIASGFFYLFFRRGPGYPNMRYPEFIVAMIYSTNMISIYLAVEKFFCIDINGLENFTMLLVAIPLKQLSGYSCLRTIIYMLLTAALLILAVGAGIVCFSIFAIITVL